NKVAAKDFIYEVSTANGKTKAARVVIDTVTIGSIRVNDVEAMVLSDKALNTVLIGMSFLNRLRGFEYKSSRLMLKR
ncbi:MAG: TIGR02281 family clan AA aspartic protease, partial [Ahrensia sp.]|nr:TIGR02281 family clan AA aspartic protease [Ahrensia sp.]